MAGGIDVLVNLAMGKPTGFATKKPQKPSTVDLYADEEDLQGELPEEVEPKYTAQQVSIKFLEQVAFNRDGKRIRGVILGGAYSLPDGQFVLVVGETGTTVKAQKLEQASTEEHQYLYPERYSLWTKGRVMEPDNHFCFLKVDTTEEGNSYADGVVKSALKLEDLSEADGGFH